MFPGGELYARNWKPRQPTVEVRIPRDRGLEHVAGAAALSVAEEAGLSSAQAKDVQVAVREACAGLAGRFFVGACETVVVTLAIYPTSLRVVVLGDGRERSVEQAETALNAYDADISLGVLKALMDSVTVLVHGRHGFVVMMSKRRLPAG